MRIQNMKTSEALHNICIYLTRAEAKQMLGALKNILSNSDDTEMEHWHLNDEDYKREITVTMYSEKNLRQFDTRSRRLILEDE